MTSKLIKEKAKPVKLSRRGKVDGPAMVLAITGKGKTDDVTFLADGERHRVTLGEIIEVVALPLDDGQNLVTYRLLTLEDAELIGPMIFRPYKRKSLAKIVERYHDPFPGITSFWLRSSFALGIIGMLLVGMLPGSSTPQAVLVGVLLAAANTIILGVNLDKIRGKALPSVLQPQLPRKIVDEMARARKDRLNL